MNALILTAILVTAAHLAGWALAAIAGDLDKYHHQATGYAYAVIVGILVAVIYR
jgi:hypothetical protein